MKPKLHGFISLFEVMNGFTEIQQIIAFMVFDRAGVARRGKLRVNRETFQ